MCHLGFGGVVPNLTMKNAYEGRNDGSILESTMRELRQFYLDNPSAGGADAVRYLQSKGYKLSEAGIAINVWDYNERVKKSYSKRKVIPNNYI